MAIQVQADTRRTTYPSTLEDPMRTLTPNIWFAGDAEDGAALYARALPATSITRTDRYPTEGLLPFQEQLAGKVLTIQLKGPGCDLVLINAGPEFRTTRRRDLRPRAP